MHIWHGVNQRSKRIRFRRNQANSPHECILVGLDSLRPLTNIIVRIHIADFSGGEPSIAGMFPIGECHGAIREHEAEPIRALSKATAIPADTVILIADIAGLFERFPSCGGPRAIVGIFRVALGETPHIGIRTTQQQVSGLFMRDNANQDNACTGDLVLGLDHSDTYSS